MNFRITHPRCLVILLFLSIGWGSLFAEPVPIHELDTEWKFHGSGTKKSERGMLYMKEAPGSLGVMLVSPEAYGEGVLLEYEIMPMTAASVCVAILAASDPGEASTLSLPDDYDGSMGHWINSVENTFFAFHNASHNRFPFAIRFPESKLIAEYHENVMTNGKFHKVEIEKGHGRVRLTIDGQLIVDGIDEEPLGSGYIAFRIRGLSEEPAACLIRNVKISEPGNQSESHWTQLFSFGDSFSDSGAGYVDGNGPTAIVYAARELGIPFTVATEPDSGSRGLNYAVSGARTGQGEKRLIKDVFLEYGMQNQVSDFVEGVRAGTISFDPEHTLFFLAGGLNDKQLETEESVSNMTQLVRRLYAVGARNIFIAVLPVQIDSFNEVATRLNPALEALPATLGEKFPDATIRTSRWGEFFDRIKLDPASYGITNTTDACAGRAIFDQDTTPRGDPETYYFYHSNHPSTAVHRHVGRMLAREFKAAVESTRLNGP